MQGGTSAGHARRFLAAYGPIAQHFRPRRQRCLRPRAVKKGRSDARGRRQSQGSVTPHPLPSRPMVTSGRAQPQDVINAPICPPPVISSQKLMSHDAGNTLTDQDPHEGLRTLPLHPVPWRCVGCGGEPARRRAAACMPPPSSRILHANVHSVCRVGVTSMEPASHRSCERGRL
jgi:hypothetical protein